MDFLIEFLAELFIDVAEGIADSQIKVKSKFTKILAIVCLIAITGVYIFLTIAFLFILFSHNETGAFKLIIVLVELLFTWYIVRMGKKIFKAVEKIKTEAKEND